MPHCSMPTWDVVAIVQRQDELLLQGNYEPAVLLLFSASKLCHVVGCQKAHGGYCFQDMFTAVIVSSWTTVFSGVELGEISRHYALDACLESGLWTPVDRRPQWCHMIVKTIFWWCRKSHIYPISGQNLFFKVCHARQTVLSSMLHV